MPSGVILYIMPRNCSLYSDETFDMGYLALPAIEMIDRQHIPIVRNYRSVQRPSIARSDEPLAARDIRDYLTSSCHDKALNITDRADDLRGSSCNV